MTTEQDSSQAVLPKLDSFAAHQWLPGQSGNPKGRRAEAHLKARLEMAAEHAPPGMTALQAVMNSLAVVAQNPSHPAWKAAVAMVLERVDGSVPKTLTIQGELPLKVVVRGDRD